MGPIYQFCLFTGSDVWIPCILNARPAGLKLTVSVGPAVSLVLLLRMHSNLITIHTKNSQEAIAGSEWLLLLWDAFFIKPHFVLLTHALLRMCRRLRKIKAIHKGGVYHLRLPLTAFTTFISFLSAYTSALLVPQVRHWIVYHRIAQVLLIQ